MNSQLSEYTEYRMRACLFPCISKLSFIVSVCIISLRSFVEWMSWFSVTFEGVFYKEHGYTKDKIILIALIYHKYMSIQKSDSITKKLHCEYTKNDTYNFKLNFGKKIWSKDVWYFSCEEKVHCEIIQIWYMLKSI